MAYIKERNNRLYVVIPTGDKLAFFATVHTLPGYFGDVDGEEVVQSEVHNVFQSLDGARKYPLTGDKAEWVEDAPVIQEALPLETEPPAEPESWQWAEPKRRGRKANH